MTFCKSILSLAILLLLSVPLTLAQGTYTDIRYPGSTMTIANSINTAGDIVGQYSDPNGKQHGFLLSGGTYTSFDAPGAVATIAYGINDSDQIVGIDGLGNGFLYDPALQTFTTLDYTLQGYPTFPAAINNAGVIVGSVGDPSNGDYFAFELSNGVYTAITVPNSNEVFASAIDNSGEILGNYVPINGGCCDAFLDSEGKLRKFEITAVPSALPIGINDIGAVVGYYFNTRGDQLGFLFASGKFQALSFPRATSTYAAAINNSGIAVGYYVSNRGAFGFRWSPPAAAEQ